MCRTTHRRERENERERERERESKNKRERERERERARTRERDHHHSSVHASTQSHSLPPPPFLPRHLSPHPSPLPHHHSPSPSLSTHPSLLLNTPPPRPLSSPCPFFSPSLAETSKKFVFACQNRRGAYFAQLSRRFNPVMSHMVMSAIVRLRATVARRPNGGGLCKSLPKRGRGMATPANPRNGVSM